MHRILIYGNAGSGKTTMARQVAADLGVVHLCLDHITWSATAVRMSFDDSVRQLNAFMAEHDQWVIEGCYGDLVEAALPGCTELRFLNPGIEACVANCGKRPWEPSYCESPELQEQLLGPLIEFVRQYETRDDEYSLGRHRAIYDGFTGVKREYTGGPS